MIMHFFLGCMNLFPPDFNAKTMDPSFSGKMKVLDYLLAVTKKETDDKFVLVSNYTETLDVFVEVIRLFVVELDLNFSVVQFTSLFICAFGRLNVN